MPAKENSREAVIIAYYLSKFDHEAVANLGFKSFSQAFKAVGEVLNLTPSSIKNKRDEFDSIHPNARAGWWQKPLSKSRLAVVEEFGNYSEETLRHIVEYIIRGGK